MKVNQHPVSSSQTLGTKPVDKSKNTEKAAEVKKSITDKAGSASQAQAATASQVQISEQAQLMRQAAEAVHALPDVREDRIQELKGRIRAGTYKVDSASVADKLVEEHFLTDFGKNNA